MHGKQFLSKAEPVIVYQRSTEGRLCGKRAVVYQPSTEPSSYGAQRGDQKAFSVESLHS